jgi:hypothetical protein
MNHFLYRKKEIRKEQEVTSKRKAEDIKKRKRRATRRR